MNVIILIETPFFSITRRPVNYNTPKPMKPASNPNRCQSSIAVPAQFCRELVAAIGDLKSRLHEKFERTHPGRGQIIRQAVAEAEELAWETSFPHLFLPDFAEVRLAEVVAAGEPVFARAA